MPVDPSFTSSVLAIASDAAYSADGDAYDASAVKVEPSEGALKQGLLRPGRQIPAQFTNWRDAEFAAIMLALISNDAGHEAELAGHTTALANHAARLTGAETWIVASSPRFLLLQYLAAGTFVVPPRCVAGFSYGLGGGGAGGGGKAGSEVTDKWIAGGAGGGGALASMQPLRGLIPGETINVFPGAGGVAGPLGATGGDGGDTTVRRGATNLACHVGAQGGRGAVGAHAIYYWVHMTMGGMPTRDAQTMLLGPAGQGIRWDSSTGNPYGKTSDGGPHSLYIPMQPGQGGFGTGGSPNLGSGAGSKNPVGGFAGGSPGVRGPDGRWDFQDATPYEAGFDSRRGGGGGGGGGAGPFGPGGGGGPGQYGDPWSAAQPTNGANAGANSGAGGGGAGSCGWYLNTVDVGGNNGCIAGNGGSGRCHIILVLESTATVTVTP